MGFTRAQQPNFRKMVLDAWADEAKQRGLATPGKPDRDWYEHELELATGFRSTANCNAGRDYERAMAHFEILSGAGIRWQMKVNGGDARRILHILSETCGEHDIDENYLRGIARRMLKRDELPELKFLTREHLMTILGEVKRHIRRKLQREESVPTNNPF